MADDHNDTAWLKSTVEQYAEKYGYQRTANERGLESYAVHLFAQEDGYNEVLDGLPTLDAELRERICRTHDLGIDGVLEDNLNKRIMLIQCAWRRKPPEEDKVATFFDAPDRLVSAEYRATGGEQIQQLLADFTDQVKDGWEVVLRFVTSASVGQDSRLAKLVDSKNRKYEERDQSISCELFGLAELRRRDAELTAATTAGLSNKVKIHFQTGKFMEINDPYPSVIGVIKGTELAGLYRERGNGPALFNLNIRLPLTSKKVNPGIVDSATNEAEHFLYYNNGVSAVCASYQWLDKNTIEATRFQVINGAQTVSALAKAYGKSPGEAYVLFRLTETDNYGGTFTDNIIKFNNTQNPVKVSDFFSNDPIQIWLRDHLPQLSGKGPLPPFYYVHKSGYKPTGATGRGVSIEQAAAIRHAFLYGPVPGYKEPKQFFAKGDNGGTYWEAFGSGGVEVKFWSPEEVAEFGAAFAVNERILTVAKTVRADPTTKDSLDAKYLYRLSRYAVGLVGVGLRAIKDATFNDFTTLIASNTTFTKYVDPLILAVRQEMRHEWRTRTAPGKEVRPEYNFARDLTTWSRLADGIRDTAVTDVLPAVR